MLYINYTSIKEIIKQEKIVFSFWGALYYLLREPMLFPVFLLPNELFKKCFEMYKCGLYGVFLLR